jgi:membrane protease YdiL (CAAX protease family)
MPVTPFDLVHVALVLSFLIVAGALKFPGGVQAAAVLAVIFLYRIKRVPLAEFWGSGRLSVLTSLGWAALALLAVYLPMSILGGISTQVMTRLGYPDDTQPAVELFLQAKDPRQLLQLILFAVVLAPLGEELFFRGLFQPAFKRLIGSWGALLLTSFLFALMHGHAPTFLPLWAFGLTLGALYEMTGSLASGIWLHALFNGATVILLLAVKASS